LKPEEELNAAFGREFTAEHQGVQANFYAYEWDQYFQSVVSKFAGGDPYDLMYLQPTQLADYTAQGMLHPLDDLIKQNGIDVSNLIPGALRTIDGKIYGWAQSLNADVIIYNKDILTKAGVPEPTPDWTWDDLFNMAKRLTVKEGGATKIYGFYMGENERLFQTLVYGMGGDLVDDPASPTKNLLKEGNALIRALRFQKELITQGISPASGDVAGVIGFREAFGNGQVALTMDAGFIFATYDAYADLNWGVCPLPKNPKGQSHSIQYGDYWAIAATSPYKDLAFELLTKKVSDIDGQLRYSDFGGKNFIGIPSWKAAQTDPRWKPSEKALVVQNAVNGVVTPILRFRGAIELGTAIVDNMTELSSTNATPEQIAQKMIAAVDNALALQK
jgi:multiple sugar transport system substrate-binding protein